METNKGYCVRVDARDGYGEKMRMLQTVADYQAIVAVKHKGATGENPHYHVVVQTYVKEQAFRVRLRKVFDQGKGNGHMSIKAWDGNIDAISYLFHEDDNAELVVRHNVSQELIDKARQRNAEVQTKMREAKERASWRLEDEVLEDMRALESVPDEDTIAKAIILKALRGNKYMPNDFLIRAMTAKIQFRLLDHDIDKEEAFADSVVQRIFHKFD